MQMEGLFKVTGITYTPYKSCADFG